jgi:hypothetical protein
MVAALENLTLVVIYVLWVDNLVRVDNPALVHLVMVGAVLQKGLLVAIGLLANLPTDAYTY